MPEEHQYCVICGRPQDSGIVVCGHVICHQCEQKIVSADVDDPTYQEIVSKLRRLWQEVGV